MYNRFVAFCITETGIRQISEEPLTAFGFAPNAAYAVMRGSDLIVEYPESVMIYSGEAAVLRIASLKAWAECLDLEIGDRISAINGVQQFVIVYLGLNPPDSPEEPIKD